MNTTLLIKIENKADIPLIDLTLSLMNVGAQYNRFLDRHNISTEDNKNPLVVKKLETGSVIIELSSMILPIVSELNTVFEFTKYIKDSYDFLLGKSKIAPIAYDKKDLDQLNSIVNLNANSPDSQMNFAANNGATQTINLSINYTEANAIQNGIKKEFEKLKESSPAFYNKQLLRWYQTRFDNKSEFGDKAIIENISKKPIRVIFDNEHIKRNIINTSDFTKPWQELAYIVDVEVLFLDEKPRTYKILGFYPEGTFDPQEEEDS